MLGGEDLEQHKETNHNEQEHSHTELVHSKTTEAMYRTHAEEVSMSNRVNKHCKGGSRSDTIGSKG